MSIQNLQTFGNFTSEDLLFCFCYKNRLKYELNFDSLSLTFIIFGLFTFIDPFADASKGVDETSKQEQPIHIRVQQRSSRKTLTTVQGIDESYDKKKLVKVFKKVSSSYTRSHIMVIWSYHYETPEGCILSREVNLPSLFREIFFSEINGISSDISFGT